MKDGLGTTLLAQVAEKWHNELASSCKGLLDVGQGSSWAKQFSYGYRLENGG